MTRIREEEDTSRTDIHCMITVSHLQLHRTMIILLITVVLMLIIMLILILIIVIIIII